MNIIAAAIWLAFYPLACAAWAYVMLTVIGRTKEEYESALVMWWFLWLGIGAALYFRRTSPSA